MEIHKLFAVLSWILLILILYIRPLAEISRGKIFLKSLRYRKHLGILCGISAIFHFFIFIIGSNSLKNYFTQSYFWNLDNFLGWGSFALVFMFFPLFTSNKFSQLILKNNWKKVQQITYLVFIFTGVHIALATGNYVIGLLPILIWSILWVWAWKKRR